LRGSHLYEELKIALNEGSFDAALALALCHMPRLAYFGLSTTCLEENETGESAFLSKYDFRRSLTVRMAELAVSGFQLPNGRALLGNLKHVDIGWVEDKDKWVPVEVCLISHFLKLPNLEQLHVRSCYSDEKMQGWACPEAASNVHTVAIWDAFLDAKAANRLLRSCKALKTFRLRRKCQTTCAPRHRLDFPDVEAELRRHAPSLEDVCLRLGACKHGDLADGLNPLTSVSQLSNLRVLRVSTAALFQKDISPTVLGNDNGAALPPCLHHLSLFYDGKMTLSTIVQSAEGFFQKHPTLNKIDCVSCSRFDKKLATLGAKYPTLRLELPEPVDRDPWRSFTFYIHKQVPAGTCSPANDHHLTSAQMPP
jgi:hypothetical protein